MTALPARELYAMFLDSDWWIELSRTKRRMVGKCERCGSQKRLESHHRFYRSNWFDTRLEDLEVLCWRCHQLHHGKLPERRKINRKKLSKRIKRQKRMAIAMADLERGKPCWKSVCRARSQGLIDRAKFEELRNAVGMNPEQVKQRHKTISKAKWERWHPGMYEGR